MKKNILNKICMGIVTCLVVCKGGNCAIQHYNPGRFSFMPDYGQGYRETYGDAYISARAGARVLHELVREDGIRFARLFPYPYFLTASSSSWDVLLYTETELNLSILDRARISQGYADVLWACVSASEAQSGSRGIADRLNYGALLERDIETVWAVDNFARRIFR